MFGTEISFFVGKNAIIKISFEIILETK